MSGLADITNWITGGANKNAQADLQNVMNQIQGISTPTADQLQLGPLDQYAMTGELSPAQMEAALAGPSDYEKENIDQTGITSMQDALAQLSGIAKANGMTPQEQAAIAEAENTANANTAGQRGAIAQEFAARGVPQSLISAALENQTAGQNADTAYRGALDARANAANQGLTALGEEGTLGNTLYNTEANQANTASAAMDALSKFNASNTQAANTANQGTRMAANTYNTTTKQNIGNQNVTGQNERLYQNQVEAPQEASKLALEKGNELMGVGEAQAGQQTAAGQQAAGLFSGLLGSGATLGSGAMQAGATNNLAGAIALGGMAEGGEVWDTKPKMPAAMFPDGGTVPGLPNVPGDSKANDTVHAHLSPGEFVVPRTAMANPRVRDFLAKNVPTPRPPDPAHPTDVASILKALSMLRAGV